MRDNQIEKHMQRRGIILLLVAYGLGLVTNILGILFGRVTMGHDIRILFWVCTVLPVVLGGLSVVLRIRYTKKLENKSVGDMQQFLVSHREQARQTAGEKLALLRRLRNMTLIYTLLFPLLAFGFGFLGQAMTEVDAIWDVPMTFWSGFLYLCGLQRIHFTTAASAGGVDPLLAKREDYPKLYEIAESCARSQGWNGKITIRLADNCNAGIHRDGDTCKIYLGVLLLNLMTEEELQAVFCHEFNHIVQENAPVKRVRRHYEWLAGEVPQHLLTRFVDLLYELPDVVFTLEFQLYRYANAIDMESTADQAMTAMASADAAASMLMKLKFHSLFQWEEGTYNTTNDYTSEEPDEAYLHVQLEQLKARMLEREPLWRELFYKEIMARNATHPTAAMRLEALGIQELPELRFPQQNDYLAEAQAAMGFVAKAVCEELKTDYAEARQEAYLKPLELVNGWEEAGKPVIAEEYGTVDDALRMLGRYQEADALCREAMEQLPDAAACQGAFLHGVYLLRSYDDSGMELIYNAIDRNHNYLDEGLAMLGEYCCITGNAQALEEYREKAVDLAQEARDVYDQMNDLNKNDQLVPENLPEELHSRLLEYLQRVDEGNIDRVYLVRKVITQEDFTSAVIVRFRENAPEDQCVQIMDKIFHFLDTCADWQFSLFVYETVAKAHPEKVENSCIYVHEEREDA